VVGLSCRFPGADDYLKFWDNLIKGVVSVTFYSQEELIEEGLSPKLVCDHSYVKAAYALEGIELFDASFFGYAGSEAQTIDPQQRLFLECAWEAFENAGWSPLGAGADNRSIGVFAGASLSSYFNRVYRSHLSGPAEAFQGLVGNDKDYLCSRVSYKLNLRGPSMSVQSACSSSLASVHQAYESLRSGACDMAIAGGVCLRTPQKAGYLYQRDMIMSPDGYCRPFDEKANGTVFSGGVGVVVLKRLADAIRDCDYIYSLVIASVINNDGAAKVGYTAPGGEGQSAVIQEALSLAELDSAEIGYVETHGTGTIIGDPIEFSALSRVFRRSTKRESQKCFLGALKANIGHADVASGIAGFIKTTLAIERGQIPPNPLFERINPAIDLNSSPFKINVDLKNWESLASTRLAGVSSFGIGGSNAHVIVQQGPKRQTRAKVFSQRDLFVLSSRNETMLRALSGKFAQSIKLNQTDLTDLCFTVRQARADDLERIAIEAGSIDELSQKLEQFAQGRLPQGLIRGRLNSDRQRGEIVEKLIGQSELETLAERYVKGDSSALKGIQRMAREHEAKKIPTPTTVFQKKRYWLDPLPEEINFIGATNVEHRVLKNRLKTALNEIFYCGSLTGSLLKSLKEHRIGNRAIAPAALFFEIFRAAAKIEFPQGFLIKNLRLIEPLPLDLIEIKLELVIHPGQTKRSSELFFLKQEDQNQSWRPLVRAEIEEHESKRDKEELIEKLEILRDDIIAPVEVQGLYEQIKSLGLDYGEHFRTISVLYRSENRALAKIELNLNQSQKGLAWSPALLDGCLQTVMGALGEDIYRASKTFVPASLEELSLVEKVPDTVWTLAEIVKERMENSLQILLNLTIYNQNGTVIGKIKNLSLAELSPDFFSQQSTIEQNCYQVQWEDGGEIYPRQVQIESEILILAEPDFAIEISSAFKWHRGDRVEKVCSNESDLAKRLNELSRQNPSKLTILHALSLSLNQDSDWEKIYEFGAVSLLNLIQKISAVKNIEIKLIIVTSGVFGPNQTGGQNPCQAAAWGLLPVIENEYPALTPKIIDVEIGQKGLRDLLSEITYEDRESRISLREGRRYLARLDFKLKIETESDLEKPSASTQTQPGCELISGALGGLGLKLCQQRVNQGATHLALLIRRAPTEEELKVIDNIRSKGVEVRLFKADLTDILAIKRALEEIKEKFAPLKKVFHLAGALDDDLLSRLNSQRFLKVLGPKAEGAFNLHLLTKEFNLEDFVMFSSTAAWFGPPGQGNYAAANAFLDALAAHRRREGLPALSVNWGAFLGAGMVERLGLNENLKHFGLKAFELEEGFSILDKLMKERATNVLALKVNWPKFLERGGLTATPPFYKRVYNFSYDIGQSDNINQKIKKENIALLQRLRNVDGHKRLKEISRLIIEKIALVLKVDSSELNKDDNLLEMGIDSLLALDLFQNLEKDFGVTLERSLLFENPTAGALSEAISEIIEKGLEVNTNQDLLINVDPKNRYASFPLMEMQQAYFVGRTGAVELGNVSCHVYLETEKENLNLEAYQVAWNKVIQRHDMLRAEILADGHQRVLAQTPSFQIEFSDLSDLSPFAAEQVILETRRKMSDQVLAPDRWPLFRVKVTCLKGGLYRLHISLDLLIADLHSMNLIMDDLAAVYLDQNKELEPINLSFRDYVLYLDKHRQSPAYLKAKEYWLNRVDSLPPAPELPLAENSSNISKPRFVRHAGKLEKFEWETLSQKINELSLTPSGLLLALYAEVLAGFSSKSHFTINVTLFNRLNLHPEVMKIVGDFTSVSLLEVNHDWDSFFIERARAIHKRLWSDLDNGAFSGVETIREWSKKTKKNASQIMPVVFTSTLGLGEKKATHPSLKTFGRVVYNITQTPQVWIDFQVREIDGELHFNWDSVDELFPPNLVENMFNSYKRLLSLLARDDNAWKKAVLPLLPPEQIARRRLSNATLAPKDEGLLIDLFIRSLKKNPEAPAILEEDGALTYAELGRAAESIARALLDNNCRKGEFIPVVTNGGREETISALAALSVGAVYVPIDADAPAIRMRYLIENTRAKRVLTQKRHLSLDWPANVKVMAVDALTKINHGDFDLERHLARPEDLAYVIHTSGSTGKPKGVMIRREGALNTICAVNRLIGLNSQNRVLALSRFTFDLSVWDIFGLLGAGGAIVLPTAQKRLDPSHWRDLMRRFKVNVWNTAPSLMQMLLDFLERRQEPAPSNLTRVLLSGDWIPLNLYSRLISKFKEAKLLSLGGATEASIWSNYFWVNEIKPEWKSIPYGRPLPNQCFFVLNDRGHDCPDWVPGKLYIGGLGVASGYHDDHQRTAESFVTHPQTGEQLYSTGDLGRYMDDGELEFLGRKDEQVKINGYRIELGEIESVLVSHPSIFRAAAVPLGENRLNYGIAAFISFKEGFKPISIDEITIWLKGHLPAYMTPGSIYALEMLPLNSSGKIDRKWLKTQLNSLTLKSSLTPPETEMEKIVASVLEAVLNRQGLGVDVRFFEMGLSSIDLVSVQTRLQDKIGREISLLNLLEHSTVRTLAAHLTKDKAKAAKHLERGANRAARRAKRREQIFDLNQGESHEFSRSSQN
jgi:amino acid adenylation domain-containing protein